ncbi:hypothetical protein PENSPDRAFT_324965 [Peniophora sp. CONT]|nr:hypothetical protein PENSPDRAFT_324965 [Peniophora sp. CONT]
MDGSYAHHSQRVPRSTSVDYEKETQHTRQLPIRFKPPSSRGSQVQRPVTKAPSLQFVPGSDDEENAQEMARRKERGKSPLVALGESIAETAKRTAFYMRPSSQSQTQAQQNGNGHTQDESYDYAAEERDFQQSQQSQQLHQSRRGVRRGNIPVDAKAYKPSESDLESESEEDSDSGRPRRRKKKKGETGGLLTGLPTVGYGGKRRKRKSMGGKEDSLATLAEEDDGEVTEKIGETLDMQRAGSVQAPPLIIRPASRPPSLPPAPPEPQPFESSLDSIDENQPPLTSDDFHHQQHQHQPQLPRRVPKNSKPKRSARSLGALTGRAVNVVLRLILFALSESLRALGRVLGTAFDALIRKPAKILGSTNFAPFVQAAVVAAIIYGLYTGLRSADLGRIFGGGGAVPVYTPPDVPAANIAELGARLQALENALGKLSFEAAHERARLDAHADVGSKLENLRKDFSRADGDRQAERAQASQIVMSVRREVEGLRKDVEGKEKEWEGRGKIDEKEIKELEKAAKAEAARVALLEERLGGVEGGLREALDLARKTPVAVPDKSHAPAWWTKLSTFSGKGLSIKGSNGEDVTELIGALVDEAVLRTQKDGLARADFALHSGGARVIPSLTSPTLDAPPRGLREALHGLLTGSGAPVGRPPVYALHHDTSAGMCWPFSGSSGTLGVALARPAFIDAVSVDHLARELAWDVRSAPRGMEVWGLVEGRENLEKVLAWEMSRSMACAADPECEEGGDTYPPELPRSAKYVRIASFEYDARGGKPVQTFDVDEGVKALGVDFGVVVLRVTGNWGAEYTCLYRVRVHGVMLGAEETGALDALD